MNTKNPLYVTIRRLESCDVRDLVEMREEELIQAAIIIRLLQNQIDRERHRRVQAAGQCAFDFGKAWKWQHAEYPD